MEYRGTIFLFSLPFTWQEQFKPGLAPSWLYLTRRIKSKHSLLGSVSPGIGECSLGSNDKTYLSSHHSAKNAKFWARGMRMGECRIQSKV